MSVSNHFQAVSVTALTYGDSVKVLIGFLPEHIRISFISGTGPVEYSFNGTEDHGRVGDPTAGNDKVIDMQIGRNEIWLKGAAGDEVVNVTAWAT